MLVLTRRVGEKLLIGDDIVITVLEVRGDGIRIGVDAPRHVKVNRSEVIDAVSAANVAAASAADLSVEAMRALIPQPTPRPHKAPKAA